MKRKLAFFMLLAALLAALALPVQAQEGLYYVTDQADLLTDEEDRELESLCRSASEQYKIGVYIIALDDYTQYGDGDVYEVTYGIYHDYALGEGEARNGIVLLLSMRERDFATFVYGADAEAVFTDRVLQQLEREFLPPFGEDDWYGGFSAYAAACHRRIADCAIEQAVEEATEAATEEATEAAPLPEKILKVPAKKEEGKTMMIAVVIGVSLLIALIVVSILKAGMKNVGQKREAGAYVSRPLNLTGSHDQYTHTTRTERKIETASASTPKAHTGGGGHGRSGKF